VAEIALDRVTKRFDDGTEAVRGASFTIRDGEFFILVGPSGCGKSTLLNLIAGLEDATSGAIRIGERVVDDLDPKDRNVAMVFQSYALYPHMTVRQNIAFPLELAGIDRSEIQRRVVQTADTLGLREQLDRRPAELSGGQRQRVAMGRAIVREPAAFLMDEPLSNLDAKLRVQMRTEIARLQRRLGTTTVYVTHDQTEAMTLGDRIAVLHRGVVEQVGTPRELYARPANLFVAGFIGSPAMNFLAADLEGGRLELPIGGLPLPEERRAGVAPGRRLVAGIRPEHLADAALGSLPEGAVTVRIRVERVEWVGSDLYAYFGTRALAEAEPEGLAGARETVDDEGRPPFVARLPAESEAREGSELELALDPRRLHLFDAETGARLDR
jgi:multiple sugar transport system ATP-binding protein